MKFPSSSICRKIKINNLKFVQHLIFQTTAKGTKNYISFFHPYIFSYSANEQHKKFKFMWKRTRKLEVFRYRTCFLHKNNCSKWSINLTSKVISVIWLKKFKIIVWKFYDKNEVECSWKEHANDSNKLISK